MTNKRFANACAGALTAFVGLAGVAGAAEVTYIITNGTTGVNEHSCTRITNVFTTQDCTFGNTQTGLSPLGNPWIGPTRQGGYYELGSAGDDLTYNPNDANATGPAGVLEPDTIKIPLRVVGTVVVDDQGTASGTDDSVRLTFSLQGNAETVGIVRSVATGQNTRAIERWQSLDLTMTAPYTVNQALPNANGGFDYIIGSRGTPTQLCRALNPGVDDTFDPNDCFPTNNFNKDTQQPQPPPWWAPRPAIGSVGIERSSRLADKPGPGNGAGPPVPNIGIATVGAFRGRVPGTNNAAYSCITNNGASDDCVNSPLMWGSSQEDPGLDNLVGIISTGTTGITSARLYWTQEYYIGAFGAPPPPGDNSYQAGIISFTGVTGTVVDTTPDAFSFTDVPGATPGAVVTSNSVTIQGINTAAPVSVTGGRYSIGCTATFTTAAGTVSNGDTVCVRQTASAALGVTTSTTLTVGGVSDTFSVTTVAASVANDAAVTNQGVSVDIPVLANDVGFDFGVALVNVVTSPQHGTVTIIGSGTSRVARYTPTPGYAGLDTFQYGVEQGILFGIGTVEVRVLNDPDGDGVSAEADNCTQVANANQRDTDGDGYGDVCDGDFNNDGRVNFADLGIFRTRFGTTDPVADLDGNGVVNFTDLGAFRVLFGSPPGPSGVVP